MDRRIGRGTFILGDCLERMREIPDGSVDMILCDLPYGTTQNKWDTVIPFEPLWREYWRVAKPNAAVVLTAAQPFTSALVMSQVAAFKYAWVWEKTAATGFLNAKKEPLRAHEDVLVFGRSFVIYRPQKTSGHRRIKVTGAKALQGDNYGKTTRGGEDYDSDERFPRSVQVFAKDNRLGSVHPTQKPVALFEYLIRTYTDEGMTVLDNCAGSGTTAIAAERTGRNWICIERDEAYFAKACERVEKEISERGLFAA